MLLGAFLNALGIVLGGFAGLTLARQLPDQTQLALRAMLGAATIYVGLRLEWVSLNGSLAQVLKALVIMLAAVTAGGATGRLLRLQAVMNRAGQYARQRYTEIKPDDPNRLNDGFTVCTLIFCVAPLGIVGAITDGLAQHWEALAVKMVMDGLAAMGFVRIFGWSVIGCAFPVFVFEGTLTMVAQRLEPWLRARALVDPINTAAGFIIICVALVLLEARKVRLADYFPALVIAPLLAWFWR